MNLKNSLLIFLLCFPLATFAGIFTITNTNNNGEGSLTWAISQANNHPGMDTLEFNIPTTDPNFVALRNYWAITLTTPLPALTEG